MNDLHFIHYDAKMMDCDIRGMSKDGKVAHFQLFNNLIIQDGLIPNRIDALLDYASCSLADLQRVKGELIWKGWIETENYFYHTGIIETINKSKRVYVAEYNRSCSMNGKLPLSLTPPHPETGVLSIVTLSVALSVTSNVTTNVTSDATNDVASKRDVAIIKIKNKIRERRERVIPILQSNDFFNAWNLTTKLPRCLAVSEKRNKILKTRMGESFFQENWKEALMKIQESAFCTGENERGWKATFDWFIQSDTVVKIMEGKYDNKKTTFKPKVTGIY